MSIKTVCFFNSTKSWGGGEKWHHDMAIEMHKNKYDVIVFTNKSSELAKRLKKHKIKIIEQTVTNFSFINPLKISKLSKIFEMNNISHIIINHSTDLKFAGIAAKKAGIKKIIYRRGSAIPIKNSCLNRYLFKNIVTDIIANTEATKKTITQKNSGLFNKNRIEVIYNGIDLNEFDNKDFSIDAKKKNEIIIGNIGRLVKQKAQHFFIDIAKELKSKKIEFKIIIGGKGKLETQLKNLCKSNDLSKEVVFTGFVKNSKYFLENIDVFVLTSLWEGFGYVLVEAMACRKPSLAFSLSSNPEIIVNEQTGFLIKPYSRSEIVEKIIYLKNNKELIIKMGEDARKRVEKYFTLEQSFKKFEKFIGDI